MAMEAINDILGRYRELLSEIDCWFERCCAAVGDQIVCRTGCSACCRGLFDITLLDACLLQDGFNRLAAPIQETIRSMAHQQLATIQTTVWQDFSSPWLLNRYPEADWDTAMPDDDEQPCILLDEHGCCRVYDSRPMTCRLHGVPLIDSDGDLLFDEWCSLNFRDVDPLSLTALQAPFNDLFKQEQLLFREFTRRLLGTPFNELDTLIPAAILIDFTRFQLPEELWTTSSS